MGGQATGAYLREGRAKRAQGPAACTASIRIALDTAQAAAPSETQSSWPASAAASRMGTALCTATSQPCFRAALSPAAAVRHDS